MRMDHIAVAAASLAEGTAFVESALGVRLAPGGQHPAMGTHNRLLSLGAAEYLEVIAIEPGAQGPRTGARWFGLDGFSGRPRVAGWVVACDDLDAALAVAGAGLGAAMDLSRGDLRWRLSVSEAGVMPFDGCHPALIEWPRGLGPAAHLPDPGCRLAGLEITHPRAADLAARIPLRDARITLREGAVGMRASIVTPFGLRILA